MCKNTEVFFYCGRTSQAVIQDNLLPKGAVRGGCSKTPSYSRWGIESVNLGHSFLSISCTHCSHSLVDISQPLTCQGTLLPSGVNLYLFQVFSSQNQEKLVQGGGIDKGATIFQQGL